MKKTILFTILSIISLHMIQAQNCQLSEEAKHHWRRANAIAENLKTSESYYKAIDEFTEVMILAPECPDVFYNLSVLYGQWAKLDSYDTYRRLNSAELFLKVCLALNPVNEEDAKSQLARLEIQIEEIAGKHEDFLDLAYNCLKNGCKDALVDRYYQLHKVISPNGNRNNFEKYFLMARSADAHYKKKEYAEAKEIYEEMLKSEFKDEYVRKRYAALSSNSKTSTLSNGMESEQEILLHFTIDHTALNPQYISTTKIFFDGKSIGYIFHDAVSITLKDTKPGMHKLKFTTSCKIGNYSNGNINIDTRNKKNFEFSIAWQGGKNFGHYEVFLKN